MSLEPGCLGDSCAGVRLSYPEYAGGAGGAAEAIDASLRRHLQSLIVLQDTTQLTLERAAGWFLAAFRDFRAEFPESSQRWQVSATVSQTYASASVIALRSEAFSDFGGAHPNSVTTFLVFDAQNGKRLTQEEIVRDVPALLRAAEPIFRSVRRLSAAESLADAGFWFPGDTLNLPANIGYAEEGLVLFYNPYEITSHAGGTTEVVVPWKVAADLVRYR
jgi:hypothetical protein